MFVQLYITSTVSFVWGGGQSFCCVELSIVVFFFVIIVLGLFYDHCCFVLQLLICLLHPIRLVFVVVFYGHIVCLILGSYFCFCCMCVPLNIICFHSFSFEVLFA